MLLLALSILLLAIGPLLYQVMVHRPWLLAALDGFVIVSVGGLILLHVMPAAIASIGGMALLVALVGVVFPLILERFEHMATHGVHTFVLIVAILGLILHTSLDGLTIAAQGHAEVSTALALAIVLHRLPVALVIWWLVRPRYGRAAALGVLTVVGLSTIGGFAAEQQLHHFADGAIFAYIQSFIAGSLFHVVLHNSAPGHEEHHTHHSHDHDHNDHGHTDHHHEDHDHGHRHHHGGSEHPFAETVGALAGGAMVACMPLLERMTSFGGHSHHHDHGHAPAPQEVTSLIDLTHWGERFVHLFVESAPALLVGYVLAGIFAAFLPRATAAWVARGTGIGRAARGMIFGLPIPICSCGVVPLYKSLVARGVPAGAAIAFLVATPELGIEALLLSIPLLGTELTIARLVAAAVVALLIGWGIGTITGDASADLEDPLEDSSSESVWARIKLAYQFGLRQVVDETAAWILAGLAVAALIAPDSLPSVLGEVPMWAEVGLFAILALPLYVCASGATPLAAALIFAGASPGAAIAFLLAGPASNVTTLGVLTEVHGRRIAAIFSISMIGLSIAAGLSVNAVIGASYELPTYATDEHMMGIVGWGAAAALVLILLFSLARTGPRSWLNTIFTFGDYGHNHDHDHGHDDEHKHDHATDSCCGHDHC